MDQGTISVEALESFRVEKACKILFISIIIGLVMILLGISLSILFTGSNAFICFIVLVDAGEFALFVEISPGAMAILNCVPSHIRSQANAIGTNVLNIFGDIPAPPVIGLFSRPLDSILGFFLMLHGCYLELYCGLFHGELR